VAGLEERARPLVRNKLERTAMTEIKATITGNVWKILVKVGDEVEEDDEVLILESMKMEIPIESIDDGTVVEIRTAEGASVKEGDVLLVLGD
jgi:acetyl-CoA carboxylase biotin carboxyl carrier protein